MASPRDSPGGSGSGRIRLPEGQPLHVQLRGPATLDYTVAPNTTTSGLSATLTIAGQIFRLVTVECAPDLACALAENAWSTEFKALTPKQPTPDASALRASVADFLADQLPEIDFLADKLH